MRANLFKIAAMGAVLSTAAISQASAAPVTFTWNPSAVGLTGAPAGSTTFTANNITVQDYSTIAFSPTINPAVVSFTDNGFLPITAFAPASIPSLSFLNLPTGTGYGLFFQFQATGTQQAAGNNPIPPNGSTYTGTINTLTFQLIGYAIPAASLPATFSFNASNVVSKSVPGAEVVLAQGSFIPGTSVVTLSAALNGELTPGAKSDETFLPCTAAVGACTADESAFFVAPPISSLLDIFNSFTNDPGVILAPVLCNGGLSECIGINGGGGNATLVAAVPEPRSLALFGTGIFALGMLLSRRRKLSS